MSSLKSILEPASSWAAGAGMKLVPAEPSALHVPHITGHSSGTLLKMISH